MKFLFSLYILLFSFSLSAKESCLSPEYQKILIEQVSHKVADLSTYPSFPYPSSDFQTLFSRFPKDKILIFSYGSLMNKSSAERTISKATLNTMKPTVAFGFKRIFNYKVSDTSRWGSNLPINEKAMLNLEPTTTYSHIINGITIEVDKQDLLALRKRETGYDLVPMLVADWQDVASENPHPKISIAYTFYVPDELREGIDYTQTKYYPVRGYLQAVREGAKAFGEPFLHFWNKTTYLGDGSTSILDWDEHTFSGILDTKEP